MLHLYNELKNKANVNFYAFKDFEYNNDEIKNMDIIILPIISSLDNENLFTPNYKEKIPINTFCKDIKSAKIIIGGKIHPIIKNNTNTKLIEYINDSDFKRKNAIPTAEAAIALMTFNHKKSINDSKCLIVGFGEIGRYLSKILLDLGAEITVSARKEKDFEDLSNSNIDYIHTCEINEHLNKYDVIFNTVPFRVFDEEKLKKLKQDQLIIDLASYPYGLNHNTAYNCSIILASSLPGKYSPISASKIIIDTIKKILKEVNSNAKI